MHGAKVKILSKYFKNLAVPYIEEITQNLIE
jgi:hypothetical protein